MKLEGEAFHHGCGPALTMTSPNLDLLDNLHPDLHPLKEAATALLDQSARVEPTLGTLQLGYRPQIAPEGYCMRLFRPLPPEGLARYERVTAFHIPAYYHELLNTLNGCFAYELSLFGAAPSMAADPPLLERRVIQPLDLSVHARPQPAALSADWLAFGAGPWSHDEGVTYFLSSSGEVHSLRSGGELVGHWRTFVQFLGEEVLRAKEAWPEYERFMSELRRELEHRPRRKAAKK